MYFFAGKYDHVDGYATNELWTVLFPDSIREDSPARVVCQWSGTWQGVEKENSIYKGRITKAEWSTEGHINIEIFRDDSSLYYWYVMHH